MVLLDIKTLFLNLELFSVRFVLGFCLCRFVLWTTSVFVRSSLSLRTHLINIHKCFSCKCRVNWWCRGQILFWNALIAYFWNLISLEICGTHFDIKFVLWITLAKIGPGVFKTCVKLWAQIVIRVIHRWHVHFHRKTSASAHAIRRKLSLIAHGCTVDYSPSHWCLLKLCHGQLRIDISDRNLLVC